MTNHKRKGPKSTRAGCLLCKPHKHQGQRARERSRRNWLSWNDEEIRYEIESVQKLCENGPEEK